MYKPVSKIRERYDISRSTLSTWGDKGYVRVKRLSEGGKRIYHIGDVDKQLGGGEPEKESFIYARVSSSKQSRDKPSSLCKHRTTIHQSSDITSDHIALKYEEAQRVLYLGMPSENMTADEAKL